MGRPIKHTTAMCIRRSLNLLTDCQQIRSVPSFTMYTCRMANAYAGYSSNMLRNAAGQAIPCLPLHLPSSTYGRPSWYPPRWGHCTPGGIPLYCSSCPCTTCRPCFQAIRYTIMTVVCIDQNHGRHTPLRLSALSCCLPSARPCVLSKLHLSCAWQVQHTARAATAASLRRLPW